MDRLFLLCHRLRSTSEEIYKRSNLVIMMQQLSEDDSLSKNRGLSNYTIKF